MSSHMDDRISQIVSAGPLHSPREIHEAAAAAIAGEVIGRQSAIIARRRAPARR